MPERYDIIKTGSRYQVVRTRDNTPIGKTYATRGEAEEAINVLFSEEYGYEIFPSTETDSAKKSAVGTVERMVEEAKVAGKLGSRPRGGSHRNVTRGL